jgi:DNA-binding MarR family transcriptional regulator
MLERATGHKGNGDSRSENRGASEERLLDLVQRLGIQLQTVLDRRFHSLGVTAQEAALLIRCSEAREISAGNLARLMGRDKGGVTRHLTSLKAKGLVQRMPNLRDRRITIVQVTSRGQKLLPRCIDIFLEMRARVLDEIFDVEIQQISGALTRMHATLTGPETDNVRGYPHKTSRILYSKLKRRPART